MTHFCTDRRAPFSSVFKLDKTDVQGQLIPVRWYKTRVLESRDRIWLRHEYSFSFFCDAPIQESLLPALRFISCYLGLSAAKRRLTA